MSAAIIGVVAIVIIVVIVLLSLNYRSNERIKCPHCGLDFTTDLFFLGQSTMISCAFCRRWMIVTRVADRNVAHKIFQGPGPSRETD